MFQTISNFMRVGDIRRKIIFTLLMLIVFRIGTFIPVPSVNADVLKIQDQQMYLDSEYIWWRSLKTSPFLQWGLCLILQHLLLFNYYKWMLYLSLLNGQNKEKSVVVN